MALILSIDTSTKVCSVALHQDGKILACSELYTEKSHSGMLTTLCENIVNHSGFSLNQLDAIAVAKGPGSYTGLRIGVSTAKGFCFALDKPLISVNTLEAMIMQISDFFPENYLFCPMIDARRMEVYCSIWDKKHHNILETEAKIIDEYSFLDLLNTQPIVFFGDGAEKCREAISHKNAIFLDNTVHPSAKTIGILATKSFEESLFENVVSFEPFYLKDFVGTQPKKV
ncbi:tRNA (adenosine(37)-N6)-threonylcarbamoyltransferase complex dimerization subunit type 1 TsaB [Arcicella lustrica]|uniref:tRNA (Adenosine(37)-N6)-threonylcarbamoyltransferase complex dimerization subunit type 1 TsaB n=1 Tax=Arcicella lustrica TaxID=2984196 RepID=A0ABU5SI14_9BACT|nr:tRNA (adenosine(37)-N6)-threonylcarbamoyltransferase complex dimerization subunit type 1 TsaB [Arcicella sp. DC25W]MEA5426911.1 tRNA (adenosine(37)-N6)-threonylcarbamoyltransferase complex dimerization subunit type 1 TsaB [Arcicella sp. DC25W]